MLLVDVDVKESDGRSMGGANSARGAIGVNSDECEIHSSLAWRMRVLKKVFNLGVPDGQRQWRWEVKYVCTSTERVHARWRVLEPNRGRPGCTDEPSAAISMFVVVAMRAAEVGDPVSIRRSRRCSLR
jgi:hypothetical protein